MVLDKAWSSADVSWKWEGSDLLLVDTSGGTVGVFLSKTTLLGSPFPSGFRVKRKVWLNLKQTKSPLMKSIRSQNASKISNPISQQR